MKSLDDMTEEEIKATVATVVNTMRLQLRNGFTHDGFKVQLLVVMLSDGTLGYVVEGSEEETRLLQTIAANVVMVLG